MWANALYNHICSSNWRVFMVPTPYSERKYKIHLASECRPPLYAKHVCFVGSRQQQIEWNPPFRGYSETNKAQHKSIDLIWCGNRAFYSRPPKAYPVVTAQRTNWIRHYYLGLLKTQSYSLRGVYWRFYSHKYITHTHTNRRTENRRVFVLSCSALKRQRMSSRIHASYGNKMITLIAHTIGSIRAIFSLLQTQFVYVFFFLSLVYTSSVHILAWFVRTLYRGLNSSSSKRTQEVEEEDNVHNYL